MSVRVKPSCFVLASSVSPSLSDLGGKDSSTSAESGNVPGLPFSIPGVSGAAWRIPDDTRNDRRDSMSKLNKPSDGVRVSDITKLLCRDTGVALLRPFIILAASEFRLEFAGAAGVDSSCAKDANARINNVPTERFLKRDVALIELSFRGLSHRGTMPEAARCPL